MALPFLLLAYSELLASFGSYGQPGEDSSYDVHREAGTLAKVLLAAAIRFLVKFALSGQAVLSCLHQPMSSKNP